MELDRETRFCIWKNVKATACNSLCRNLHVCTAALENKWPYFATPRYCALDSYAPASALRCNHVARHLQIREQSHANLSVQIGGDIRPPCRFALAHAGGLAHQVNLHRLERKLRCQLLPVRRIFVRGRIWMSLYPLDTYIDMFQVGGHGNTRRSLRRCQCQICGSIRRGRERAGTVSGGNRAAEIPSPGDAEVAATRKGEAEHDQEA